MNDDEARELYRLLKLYKDTYGEDAPDTMTLRELIDDLEETLPWNDQGNGVQMVD